MKIIINEVYNHNTIPPSAIKRRTFEKLLLKCTTQVPFTDPNGTTYIQIDGVSMGSPQGPTFAEYYMIHLENKIFPDSKNKSTIYARYVDDIFIASESVQDIKKTQTKPRKILF